MHFRTGELQQARSILAEEVPHLICLPLKHLWESYPVNDSHLANVKRQLARKGLLSDEGKWNPGVRKERFARPSGVHESKLFNIFSRTFNAVLSSLADCDELASGCVEKMVHAGSIEPQSDRASSHRPDAFLLVKTPPKPVGDRFRWRDITCPFEYKFANGSAVDVSQPESFVLCDHVLTVYRTTRRLCGASTTSCVAIPVGFSPSGSPYMAPSFAFGCCAVLHPLCLPTLTGSKSVYHPIWVFLPNIS